MAELNKEAKAIQREFLPYGTEIAALSHTLHSIGAHQSARLVQDASLAFHQDVERIIKQRSLNK